MIRIALMLLLAAPVLAAPTHYVCRINAGGDVLEYTLGDSPASVGEPHTGETVVLVPRQWLESNAAAASAGVAEYRVVAGEMRKRDAADVEADVQAAKGRAARRAARQAKVEAAAIADELKAAPADADLLADKVEADARVAALEEKK